MHLYIDVAKLAMRQNKLVVIPQLLPWNTYIHKRIPRCERIM